MNDDLTIPAPPGAIAEYAARCSRENRAPADIAPLHRHALPPATRDRQLARQALLLATTARERAEHAEALATTHAHATRAAEQRARERLAAMGETA